MDNQLKEKIEELNIKHQKEVKATILSHNIFLEIGVKPTVYTHYEREAIGLDFDNEFNIGEKHTLKKVFTYLLKHFPLDTNAENKTFSYASKEPTKADGCWSIEIEHYGTKLKYESEQMKIFCTLPKEEIVSYKRVEYNTHKKNCDVFMQPFLNKDFVKYTNPLDNVTYATGEQHSKRHCYSGTNEQLIQMMNDYANS